MSPEYETLVDLTRAGFIEKAARAALAKAAGEGGDKMHKFMPEPGKNECKTCGSSYKEGNHFPMGKGQ